MFKESGPRPEPPPQKSLYETIGVSPQASEAEIKAAFKKNAFETHPDRPGGDTKKFQELNEAYQTLSDAARRTTYDAKLSTERLKAEASHDAQRRQPETPRRDPQEIFRENNERRQRIKDLQMKDDVYREQRMEEIRESIGIKQTAAPPRMETFQEENIRRASEQFNRTRATIYEGLSPEARRQAEERDTFTEKIVNQINTPTTRSNRPGAESKQTTAPKSTEMPRISPEDLAKLRQEAKQTTAEIRRQYGYVDSPEKTVRTQASSEIHPPIVRPAAETPPPPPVPISRPLSVPPPNMGGAMKI